MLAEIHITGLGVIEDAAAEPAASLTVLTGETGAGKTMVVTGLHLLAGGRADAGRVRRGVDRAVVEGRFDLTGAPAELAAEARAVLAAAGGGEDEDGTIIAVRTVGADGRSRAHLGGRSVPASTLARFTAPLLAIHGQNDQLRLLRPDRQRAALDRFDAARIGPLLADYRTARAEWTTVRADLADRTTRARELAQEADLLRHGLDEIDAITPEAGEDERLVAEIRRLVDVDTLREATQGAHVALLGGDALVDAPTDDGVGAADLLGRARAHLNGTDDGTLRALATRLDEAIAVVSDVGGEVGMYLDDLPVDPALLEKRLARQAELKTLTRKYAADAAGVVEWAEHARERLGRIDTSAGALDELRDREMALRARVVAAARALTAARAVAAASLTERVTAELAGLAMGRSRIAVALTPATVRGDGDATLTIDGTEVHAGVDGTDEIEFRLAAHADDDDRPLARAASGGELSRVMLALEVVLAGDEGGTTLVFDEVDAGVGGRAAIEIGRRLATLARSHQVIVVTHLPQVAAFADLHLVVDKTDADCGGAVTSGVLALEEPERVAELARMLAGIGDTDTGRAHAEELLAAAAARNPS